MYLHCQSTYQAVQHIDAALPKPIARCPGPPNHSRNTDWRTFVHSNTRIGILLKMLHSCLAKTHKMC